jgi:hypothetical protein
LATAAARCVERHHRVWCLADIDYLGAGLDAFMVFVETRRAYYFLDQLKLEFDVQSFTPSTFTVYLMAILLVLLVPAALFFMYQIRRNPSLGADQGQAGLNQGRRYFD